MKRIAGAMMLLASLGGCVSLTTPSAAPHRHVAAASRTTSNEPASPYARTAPPVTHSSNSYWATNSAHHPPANHVAARQAPTTPAPRPMQSQATAAIPPKYPVESMPRPQPPSTETRAANQAIGKHPPLPALNLPRGMPQAVTPATERAANVPATPTRLDDAMLKQVSYESKSPQPLPNMPNATTISPTPPAEPKQEVAPSIGNDGSPMMRLVNTKRITMNFEVKDVGPSGLAGVELWYTQDCRDWRKYDAPTQAQAYVIEVDEEGTYGFTLLAKSGIGLAKEPPKSGDLPQVWVIVDLTPPQVRLTEIVPIASGRGRQVTIGWQAADKNLGRKPITLFYAEKEEGPWAMLAGNLENTGKFVWQPPNGLSGVHFKVEAVDLAGNVGRATTSKAVYLETSLPTVSITNIDSAPMN